MPHSLLRHRRHFPRQVLFRKPLVLPILPLPLLLLRLSRVQAQSLGLEQRSQHSDSLLTRSQSPAKFSVKRADDFVHFLGVGRMSPFRLQGGIEQIFSRFCLVFVVESGIISRSAGVCGVDVGCAAVGLLE